MGIKTSSPSVLIPSILIPSAVYSVAGDELPDMVRWLWAGWCGARPRAMGKLVSAGAVLFCLGPSWEVEASGGRQRFLPQPFLLPPLPVPRSALFAQVWKGEGMGEVNH